MESSGHPVTPRRELRFLFGDCQLDGRSLVLSVRGSVVKLERKPLEMLLHLLQHAGEVVTKQELLDEVWAGRILSDAVLTKTMARLRQALGDESQVVIRTVHGYGYRLVAAVTVEASGVALSPTLPELAVGDAPPLRPLWRLERRLGSGSAGDAWLGRHTKTGESRVFKFALDAAGLTSLKREITLYRVMQDSLSARDDVLRLLDWNLEEAPLYLESEFAEHGSLLDWSAARGGLAAQPLALRLELMAQVAEALAAAHSVGVLHKDLKPGNVLVAGDGDSPHIKLGDFGSGRLVDLARLEALEITRLGFTAAQAEGDSGGTPLYVAPELLAGQSPTARSDIYALGVMLYHCVTGDTRRPLAPGWESDIDDPLLREDIAAAAAGDPAARLGDAGSLAKRLRTLDARRAERAAELTAREEAGRLHEALAVSRIRRRRWGIASATLATGLCVVTVLLLQVSDAQKQARVEADMAAAVNQFLTEDLLAQANPLISGRSDVQVRDLLDSAAQQVGNRFNDRPATEASVRMALGNAYLNLGEFAKAQRELERALQLAQGQTDSDAIVVNARSDLAKLQARSGDAVRSQETLAPLLTHPDTATRLRAGIDTAFAQLSQGDAAASLARLDAIAPEIAAHFQAGSSEAITTTAYQANALRELGRYDEAIAKYRESLAGRQALHGAGHIATLEPLRGLGGALTLAGRHDEALVPLEAAMTLARDVYGERHDHTLAIASDLALVLQNVKQFPRAEALMLSTLAARAESYGKDSPDYRSLLNNLGVLYGEKGDFPRQHEYLAQSCAAEHTASGEDHPQTLICDHNLARALVDFGRLAEAESLERRTMERALPVFGPEHAFIGIVGYTYASIEGQLGRKDAAERGFEEAITLLDKALGPGNERSAKAVAMREAMRSGKQVPPPAP
ncbi:MAG: hypothetical protein DCF27_03720 [Lysobacteraceae bacterium]|nr:MAG: hypothetical protein DCF27_03720 [Xanthomonadaceae bacterium]